MERQFISVDGIRTHVVVAGEAGPPVVLLHGLGASVACWQENIGPLSQRFRVFAIDLPGHGDSDKPSSIDYTIPRGVHYLLALLDTLALPQAAFIGNSMGGLLVLKTALEHPERVSKLVLVDSAGLGRELHWFVRLTSVPLLGELLEQPTLGGARTMLKNVFYDPHFATNGLAQELYRTRASPGAKAAVLASVRHGVNLLGVKDSMVLLHQLPWLRAPLFLIWGEQDKVFPVAHAYRAKEVVPSARLVAFPRCGHWPMMEHAQEFNRAVGEFLAEGLSPAPERSIISTVPSTSPEGKADP
ncbi:MAG: alpha/beta fold hydrolase [Chloroflexi bacterium]|nr:alpha/beta fold hydrolase [Chloroflexota bacterium]